MVFQSRTFSVSNDKDARLFKLIVNFRFSARIRKNPIETMTNHPIRFETISIFLGMCLGLCTLPTLSKYKHHSNVVFVLHLLFYLFVSVLQFFFRFSVIILCVVQIHAQAHPFNGKVL